VVYADSAVSGSPLSSSSAITGRLHVGTAGSGELRWALADITPLVEEARLLRDLSPLAAIGFGQLLTAAVLLTRLVSKDPLRLVLEVRGDGPLGHVRAEADTHGRVRGLVERNLAERVPAPTLAGAGASGPAPASPDLGTGTLRVVRQMRKQNYESRVSLVEGGVARNVVHFLEQSEQIRSAVMLGVLTRPAGVVAGGGLIVEALPGADPVLVRGLETRIAQLPSISGLLEDGGPWALLDHAIGEVERETLEERQLILTCDCDRERFRGHLRSLVAREPALLGDDEELEVQCNFCGAEYRFPVDDLLTLQ
jgi:molecular chaperone Hsp33